FLLHPFHSFFTYKKKQSKKIEVDRNQRSNKELCGRKLIGIVEFRTLLSKLNEFYRYSFHTKSYLHNLCLLTYLLVYQY
ncbi:hypothetical protein LINPERHAP1_LOCUS17761, partial [Linum perenne]